MDELIVSRYTLFGYALPPSVEYVIDKLEDAGYPSYLVGGCVRDALLGMPPHDYDVATAATPQEIGALFSDCKLVTAGIKHGTVAVIYKGLQVEATAFRRDGCYADHRHPFDVQFTRDPEEDAARRDFTANALFYSPHRGLFDPFDGLADIKSRTLRAVGAPFLRFEEDALRILRALRFSATLGFAIEPRTEAAMYEKASLIGTLASERVLSEFKIMFRGENIDAVTAKHIDIIKFALGGDGLRTDVEAYPPENRLAVFTAHYGGDLDGAARCIARLKADKKTKVMVHAAATAMYGDFFADRAELARAARSYGTENARLMCAVFKKNGKCGGDLFEYIDALENGTAPLEIRDLKICGNDLAACGVPVGVEMGLMTEKLYDYVHNGGKNEKDTLMNMAKLYSDELKKGKNT